VINTNPANVRNEKHFIKNEKYFETITINERYA
jgi:hypothetical protein